MIEVQAYIMFLAASFFTALYVATKNNKESFYNVLGIFAAAAWIALGGLWLFVAYESSAYTTYPIGLLFNAFGIIIFVLIVLDLLEMKSLGKTIQ